MCNMQAAVRRDNYAITYYNPELITLPKLLGGEVGNPLICLDYVHFKLNLDLFVQGISKIGCLLAEITSFC